MKDNNENNIEVNNEYYHKHIIPVLNERSQPVSIYHYTDIYGLDGILKKKEKLEGKGEFWVSNTDFLNDRTEVNYTIDLSIQIFKKICKEKRLNQEKIDEYIHLYKQLIEINYVQFEGNYYALSFSTNSDSNLLWSNYSKNDGYNIGFDFRLFIRSIEPAMCSYVFYDKEKQTKILKSLLEDILTLFMKNTADGKFPLGEEAIGASNVLIWFFFFFKDSVFSQEEEFRIVFILNPNENYQCRPSNGTFIPYIERSFNKKAVSSITVGPKNNMDINLEGLHKFLKLHEFDIPDYGVKKSNIPYRF
ncbi:MULTISPECIES: DUF2971 domain-containing protein [Bacillus]|uniref:DUF2971 domain-containing protein n=1 Tax=Bacillus TaxID=1386 RepID=UPI0002D6884C|nr:DUF2971 domain-containing protein [Bacillus altitudinis]MDI4571659.1 DUF2971 domain-containing protein [Bacillus altitudinis]BDC59537.1 hypothetical protein NC3_24970 [Bacillus altitudinis]